MSGAMFKLGGGIQGFQPKLLGGGAGTTGGSGMDGASTRGLARKVLRTGFGRFGKKDWSEGFRLDIEGRPENGEYFRVDESDPTVKDLRGMPPEEEEEDNLYETILTAVLSPSHVARLPPPAAEFFKNEKYLAMLPPPVGSWAVFFEMNNLGKYTLVALEGELVRSRNENEVFSSIFNYSFEDLVLTTTPLSPASPTWLPPPTSQVFYHLDKNESITPFRQAYNAGDPNGYINQSSTGGESNHLNNIGLSSSLRVYARSGGVKFNGKATFAGNPKFVYAGDDYVRFKKLAAINKTYNDKSFGGDESNASFTSLMSNY
uniref:Uncharacterized protein n=2 Tax=viral metagenome TaxID=1070528 RepID=A0A6C0BWJ1_9ZZZZ